MKQNKDETTCGHQQQRLSLGKSFSTQPIVMRRAAWPCLVHNSAAAECDNDD